MRWFYRTLRVVSALMTALVAFYAVVLAVLVLLGNTELVSEFLELERLDEPLTLMAKIAFVGAAMLSLFTFWQLLSSINLVLKSAENGELFINGVDDALMRMGTAMILLYFVFLSYDIVIPAILLPGEIFDNMIDFLVAFVDLNALTLLIGVVLRTVSVALRQGRVAQDELKQFL